MKTATIKDTGERMVPEFTKGKLEYGEHIVRYEGAVPIVKNKVILDIASGSGYGTALLAQAAKKVYGVDYDADAINYAKSIYGQPNVEFIQGSATKIPLDDNSVDVVVSFETLEHIEDYQKFMREIRRVLTKDGLLILSTPNDKEFPEGAHFHIHEFKQKELESLVKKYFNYTKSYYQVTWKYNALIEEKSMTTEHKETIPTINVAPINLDKVLYFYMLCSNRKINETIEPIAALSEHWSTREMLEHNGEIDQYIRGTIKHFEKIITAKDSELSGLRKEISDLQTSLSHRAVRFAQRVIKKS